MALITLGDQQRGIDLLERVQPRGAALWFWLRFAGVRPRALGCSIPADPRFRRIVEESRPG